MEGGRRLASDLRQKPLHEVSGLGEVLRWFFQRMDWLRRGLCWPWRE